GFLTIGQSPRDDVVPDIVTILGPGFEIIEQGALNGLSRREIEALHPGKNDFPLITRLRDGATAVVGKRKILSLIQARISSLERQNADLVALLCTDDFPQLHARKPLLLPHRILLGTVRAVMKEGRLGVLAPLAEQKNRLRKKWLKTGLEIFIDHLNPYQKSSAFDRVMERMKRHRVNLIVLDCIGYSLKMKEKIRLATGRPVLLPRSLLAGLIKELISVRMGHNHGLKTGD
ncbi:MAG: AroM family protein, partial [Candidatus Aminicenantes bacterium]|nr:AroM family protein [Candidatus Aminicenantes bacterium]